MIRGKGSSLERLPLPADVGQSVADYLRRARPNTTSRRVFMTAIAPIGPLSPAGVTEVVVLAGRRAGLGQVTPHRLRHTVATEILRRGAPLGEIGQVLRHHRAASTAIYAKVDRDGLRALARPWPGGAA